MKLRKYLFVVPLLCIGTSVAAQASEPYPTRAVKMIVGYSAGGGADTSARIIAKALTDELGQSFVVENKPGASGVIAVSSVASARPDGYTLLVVSAGELVQPVLRSDLPYDFQADLIPVSFIGSSPFVLAVNPSVPAKTVAELVAYGKANPSALNFGSSGIGTSPHLAGELFALRSGTPMTHVPYKGGNQAAAATVSGEIQVSYPATTSALPLVKAGRLRALAVTTTKRTAFMPDLPTLHELGMAGFQRSSWYAIMAPKGTQRSIVERINRAVENALANAEVKRVLEQQGIDAGGGTPEQLSDFIRAELAQNAEIVKQAGLSAAK